MSKVCQLTGKKPMFGHSVSHSNVKTKRRFNPNVRTKKIYIREIDTTIKVKLTNKAMRNMEKLGAYVYIKRQLAAGFDPLVWVVDQEASKNYNEASRGYRRVEHTDTNGVKSYLITYEKDIAPLRKVKLSKLFK